MKAGSIWTNPFGLSPKVEISRLAGKIEFQYATVFAQGPSHLAFSGTAAFLLGEKPSDKFEASADIVVTNNPSEQLLKFDITNLDVAKLIRFAGELTDSDLLRRLMTEEDEGLVLFHKAGMSFSTGVTAADGVFHAPGIAAYGDLTVFRTNADFKASLGSEGMELLGNIDPFVLGPLEVRAASSEGSSTEEAKKERAKLYIAMTKDKQLIDIDGVVRLKDANLELKASIRITVEPRLVFDVCIFIQFTAQVTFDLKANATGLPSKANLKTLSLFEPDSEKQLQEAFEKANVHLEATLIGDPLQAFADGVLALVNELQNVTQAGTEALEILLDRRLRELEGEVGTRQSRLESLRAQVAKERAERKMAADEAEKNRKDANGELSSLEKAMDDKLAERTKAEKSLQDAELEFNILQRQKMQEYETKLDEAMREHAAYEAEKRSLEERKRVRFGVAITELHDLHLQLRDAQCKSPIKGDPFPRKTGSSNWNSWLHLTFPLTLS